jgi:hypothetical protein
VVARLTVTTVGRPAAAAHGAHDVDQSGSSTLMMQFSLDNARRRLALTVWRDHIVTLLAWLLLI